MRSAGRALDLYARTVFDSQHPIWVPEPLGVIPEHYPLGSQNPNNQRHLGLQSSRIQAASFGVWPQVGWEVTGEGEQ